MTLEEKLSWLAEVLGYLELVHHLRWPDDKDWQVRDYTDEMLWAGHGAPFCAFGKTPEEAVDAAIAKWKNTNDS